MTDPPTTASSRSRWVDAVAVLAVIVTVLVAARQLRPLVEAATFALRHGTLQTAVPTQAYVRAGVWVAIAVAVFLRWRGVAAVGAWAAVGYEVVLTVLRINSDKPNYGLDLLVWPVVLAVVAALLLSLPIAAGRGVELLRRPGRWLLLVAGSVAALSAMAIPLLWHYDGPPPVDGASIDPGFYVVWWINGTFAVRAIVATVVAVALLTLACTVAVEAHVRRRLVTLVLAAATALLVIELGMPRPLGWVDGFYLGSAVEIALLVAGPAVVLALGLAYIRLRERPTAAAGALA